MIESNKYEEACEIYEYLFKSDPFSTFYLEKYILSLKRAFKFDELEKFKESLMNCGWINEENENLFDWKSDLSSLITKSESESFPKDLEVLTLPLRNPSWTNYSMTLFEMATGNYSKIFKKLPFNPENYLILNGPCQIELLNNSTVYSQATNTQSLLINSVHDYSASSMDDVSKKRSLRRKETRATQSIPSKTELNASDLVKFLKTIFGIEEQEIVDILCSTERSCLQLLDKNNIATSPEGESFSQYSLESLNLLISRDNESFKPLSQRIFELISFFFVHSRQQSPEFPQSLSKSIIDLWELFRIGVLSMDALKDSLNSQFYDLLLGVCEVCYTLKKDSSYEMGLLERFYKAKDARFHLLEILLKSNETEKIEKLIEFRTVLNDEVLFTRYSYPLTAIVNQETLSNAIKVMQLGKTVESAENSIETPFLDKNAALELANGEMKLRLCKLFLNTENSAIFKTALLELIKCHGDLEITKFLEFLTCFNEGFNLIDSEAKCNFACIFWNLYTRKQLIPNNLIGSLNASFAHFLASLDAVYESIEQARFILNWMAQEKCFGSANGLVPLKIFQKLTTDFTDFTQMKFAYSVIFSVFKFTNIFTTIDPEAGLEEWDRSPIGLNARDSPCPNLSESQFFNLCKLVHFIDLKIDEPDASDKIVISEPGFVAFVDWIKKQFETLCESSKEKHFFHCFNLNRNGLSSFFSNQLELHAQKQIINPSRGHYTLEEEFTASFRYLLNTRSDIVFSELQGRKKSLEILKTIRSDLKTSLSLNISDGEVWCLLGSAYHDAAVHYLSSEADFLISNNGKLKRCIKKSILALVQGLKSDRSDRESWIKLMDLIDWSLHEPSLLLPDSNDKLIINYLTSIGCSCVQNLIPGVVARDRWNLFLRLELFLRKSGNLSDPIKQLELLMEASRASCLAYSENVYESTALYMSLVKFYSRLSKLRMRGILSESDLSTWLDKLQGLLPVCLQVEPAESGDLSLLRHLDALNVLDRKKIFHSHWMALAWHSSKLLNDPQGALNYLQNIFPFLKQQQKKTNSSCSLLQIYQCEHERPARFLAAGHRYLLQLLDFFSEHVDTLAIGSLPEILVQFLKKLYYIRKTILGFAEILLKATLIYLACPERDEAIVVELIDSVKAAFNGKIPLEIQFKLKKAKEERQKEKEENERNEEVQDIMDVKE